MVAPTTVASVWMDEQRRTTAAEDDSPTYTTHSSPYDLEEEPERSVAFVKPPNKLGSDDDDDDDRRGMVAHNDVYRCVETPRAAAVSSSIYSIQIQVESAPRPTGENSAHLRRRRSGFGGSPGTPVKDSWRRRCEVLPLNLLVILVPPTLVLVLLKFSVVYVMLLVVNVAVAFAGWEWSWWCFRIRQRLLVAFRCSSSAQPLTAEEFHELRDREVNQNALAIASLARTVRGHIYVTAMVLSVVLSAALVGFLSLATNAIVGKYDSTLARVMLVTSTAVGCVSVLFCGCLVPTRADGFVLFVYEACYVVSSLNSFLTHHEHIVHDPELLDSMYVLLVGACAIVVWRIVSSKEVLETMVMVMADVLGLAYIVAPMMAMADFLGHPTVKTYGDIVGTFFVVVSAAEAAYYIATCLRERYPHLLQWCRRPILKSISHTVDIESLLLSIGFGVVGSALSALCFHTYTIRVVEAVVFLGVILMSQLCRVALESMKELACVLTPSQIKYKPWVQGAMDLLNPYILAMIVFHPYIKALIKS